MGDANAAADAPPPRNPSRKRRLSDYILIAFHAACDHGDIEAAGSLLGVVGRMVARPSPAGHSVRRSDIEPLVAAHERLWTIRHPEAGER